MRNPLYLRQLKRDLDHWINAGLVDADCADEILETAGQGGVRRSLSVILAMLGVILLGMAAMSFVAANFWGIPKIVQLSLLFGAMWAAYGAGWYLTRQGHGAIAQAAVLLGVALYGVNIMLIAQIYHINAHYPDGVMAWALGSLVVAILIPSRAALASALIIASIWTWLETIEFDAIFHWPFLIFVAVSYATAHLLRWRPGFHLSVLALIFWLTLNTVQIAEELNWEPGDVVALYSLLWLAVWSVGAYLSTTSYPYATALERYGVFLFFVAFFVLHMLEADDFRAAGNVWSASMAAIGAVTVVWATLAWSRRQFTATDGAATLSVILAAVAYPYLLDIGGLIAEWAYRGLFLIIAIWILGYGTRHDDRFIINASFVAFGAEALAIYFDTFDTLLNQSLFFALGGLLLIAVSFFLERLRRRVIGASDAEAVA